MWKNTNQIVAIRRQINGFHQINWKIIDGMFPDAPAANPRGTGEKILEMFGNY